MNQQLTLQSKVLSTSSIIHNQTDFNNLIHFFNQNILDLNLLFKASQHNFNISQFWNKCGTQTHLLFICINNFDKILGAYSPLSHTYTGNQQQQFVGLDFKGEWAADHSKTSFVFSLTNNDKFEIKNEKEAIFRTGQPAEYHSIQFGSYEFKLCDFSNTSGSSAMQHNNGSYRNEKYQKDRQQDMIRLVGDVGSFRTKQWQVWRVKLEE